MLYQDTVICLPCNIAMRRVRAGVNIIETYQDPPRPYRLYHGDLHRCPNCGKQTVTGLGKGTDVTFGSGKKEVEEVLDGLDEYFICYERVRDAEEQPSIG